MPAHSTYAADKSSAEETDRELGFSIEEIERRIRPVAGPETWAHLSPQVFQTPYAELGRIVEETDPDRTLKAWADLGAAYGRLGIVLARIRPEARFIGIELVAERVHEARRIYKTLGLPETSIAQADLTTAPLPVADVYFIYDFGTRAAIENVLEKLRGLASSRPIRVIGRGRGVRDTIEREHPWLGGVIPPLHSEHYSIYRSA